jgi:glutathione S-transferase
MLKIWGRATSMNVQKVMWAVGELGIVHERIDVGGRFGGLDKPAYLAMNPNARVPTLEDGRVIVWESNAIVRYLAARYGEELLWDRDPGRRAVVDQWMDWMQTTLAPDFYDLFFQVVRLPAARQKPQAIADAGRRLSIQHGIIERQLGKQPYLLGERLSMADIVIGATLYRYFEMAVERPALPVLRGWYDRLVARPAYRTHVMVSFEELRGNAG